MHYSLTVKKKVLLASESCIQRSKNDVLGVWVKWNFLILSYHSSSGAMHYNTSVYLGELKDASPSFLADTVQN